MKNLSDVTELRTTRDVGEVNHLLTLGWHLLDIVHRWHGVVYILGVKNAPAETLRLHS